MRAIARTFLTSIVSLINRSYYRRNMTTVVLHTNVGNIKIKLYKDMPITTENFVKLAKEGFYDGVIFHRVINEFMIQTGDPTGTGSGGPGYEIPDEFVKGHSNRKGTVAMANCGKPNTGGSQFFINCVNNPHLDWDNTRTPYAHPVFGEVTVDSMITVSKIEKTPVDEEDRPLKPIKIMKAEVIE